MIGIAQAVKADDIRMFPPAGNSPPLLEIRTIVLQLPLPQFHLLKDLEDSPSLPFVPIVIKGHILDVRNMLQSLHWLLLLDCTWWRGHCVGCHSSCPISNRPNTIVAIAITESPIKKIHGANGGHDHQSHPTARVMC